MNTEHVLLKNAVVEVSPTIDHDGRVNAHIVVNDTHQHTFNGCSRLSQYLASASNPDQMKEARQHLQDRLTGGSFFFVGEHLADFRDRQYDGFTHTDAAIDKLMNLVGIEENPSHKLRSSLGLTTPSSAVALLGKSDANQFHVPGYLEGGAFTTGLIHAWSPFQTYIKSMFEIVRVVCSNGAIASTDLINTKIPLINRWEEHLAIAERQLQNMIDTTLASRFAAMGVERATVAELQKIVEIGKARLDEAKGVDQINRINKLIHTADPETHLANFYNPIVFDDTAMANRSVGHLTVFDAWNICTEMYSHTNGVDGGSDNQLQRLSNVFLFPKKETRMGRNVSGSPVLSSFSDPDQAFFGMAA